MPDDVDEADLCAALASQRLIAQKKAELQQAQAQHGADLKRLSRRLSLRRIAQLMEYRSDTSVRRAIDLAAKNAPQQVA